MKNQNTKIILIDFDGVIAPKSIEDTIHFLFNYINCIYPISKDFILNYFKSVASFPVKVSLYTLFFSLGIEELIPNFLNDFKNFNESEKDIIDPEFIKFIKFCEKNRIKYYIVSLSTPERLKKINFISKEFILSLEDSSKANPKTFKKIVDEIGVYPQNCFIIDDSPMTLRAAKMNHITTIIRTNTIFSNVDYENFSSSIDYKVQSFSQVQKIINNFKEI